MMIVKRELFFFGLFLGCWCGLGVCRGRGLGLDGLSGNLDRLLGCFAGFLGVLGNLVGNALAGSFDLLAQLVVVLREGRLHLCGNLLHASSRLTSNFLAASLHVGHDFLTASSNVLVRMLSVRASISADVLRLAPSSVHLFRNQRASFLTRAGGAQQSHCSASNAACQENTVE